MSESYVVFSLNGENLTIKCSTEDKMKDICQKYSIKINKNMDSLLFLYEGKEINFDLSFKEQANIIDRNNHNLIILVHKNNNKTNNINNDIILSNTINTNSNSGNANCLKSGNLLENIKSIFFLKILFLNLNEKIKLEVIKYRY